MGVQTWLGSWPAYRQLTGEDRRGLGRAARSKRTDELRPRTAEADKMVGSGCPYCAGGCGQRVFVQDGRVTQIEGDEDSPVSRGRLCPKGSASLQLTTGSARQYQVLYRREGWQWEHQGQRTRRTMSLASLGGATLDNEENYLIKKLFTALGAIQIENQARI